MMDYRAALTEFYKQHNPDKLREVDLLLAKYRGREEELLHALKVKYGVHKTAASSPPPPPPQSTPPPPSQPQSEAEKPASEPEPKKEPAAEQQKTQASKPDEQKPADKTERIPTADTKEKPKYERPLEAGADKGKSAAERAEYWKNELEKRERERAMGKQPSESNDTKFTSSKSKKQPPPPEPNAVAGNGNSGDSSGFPIKTIVFILILLALLGGIIYTVLNDNIRNSVLAFVGLGDKTEQPKVEKKEVIEPDMLGQTSDAGKKDGEFALDDEEDLDENNEPSSPQASTQSASDRSTDSRAGDNARLSGDGKVSGGLQRNFWYLSYVSVSSEAKAQKIMRDLQAQGIDNAGYYYIPEYNPGGNKFYKVYIGPYSSVEGAERSLSDDMRKISPGAYPYLLK